MIIFSMGIFVILAAVLTKVFNLANIWDPSYMLWYTREASVAVYVSNLPMIWPLLREWFPVLKALTPGQKISSGKREGYGNMSSSGRVRTTTNTGRRNEKFGGKRGADNGIITTIHGKGESMEDLSGNDETEMRDIEAGSWEQHNSNMSQGDVGLVESSWDSHKELRDLKEGGITMTTTVQISEEHILADAGLKQSRIPVAANTKRDVEQGVPVPGFKWDFHHDEKRLGGA